MMPILKGIPFLAGIVAFLLKLIQDNGHGYILAAALAAFGIYKELFHNKFKNYKFNLYYDVISYLILGGLLAGLAYLCSVNWLGGWTALAALAIYLILAFIMLISLVVKYVTLVADQSSYKGARKGFMVTHTWLGFAVLIGLTVLSFLNMWTFVTILAVLASVYALVVPVLKSKGHSKKMASSSSQKRRLSFGFTLFVKTALLLNSTNGKLLDSNGNDLYMSNFNAGGYEGNFMTWRIIRTLRGAYIQHVQSGKYLAVEDSKGVYLDANRNTSFNIQKDESGKYTLIKANTTAGVLDADDDKVYQFGLNNSQRQHWIIAYI